MAPPARRTLTLFAVTAALALACPESAHAQGVACLVYLKSGEVVPGWIEDRPPGAAVTVVVTGGASRTYPMAEVDSIVAIRRLEPAVKRPARALRPRSLALGLSAAYSHGRSEVGSETTGRSEDVGLSASVSFFVVPGLALGVGAGISRSTSSSTYETAPLHGTTSMRSTSWGLGPYVAYYLGAGRRTARAAGSLYPYVAAGVHLGGGSDSTAAEYYGTGVSYVDFISSSFSGHSAFVEAGVLCLLADWAGIAAGVTYTDEASRQRSASMSSIQAETAHASTRYLDVQVGLRWFLY